MAALGWPRDHVAWLFFYGILLFSGSLYMRALGTGQVALVLGALSPLLLLLGWLAPGLVVAHQLARRGTTGADPWRPLTAVKL